MISETTIRQKLSVRGFRMQKTPARHWTRSEYGPGYMIMNDRNIVVLGCTQRPFDATLDEAEAFLSLE